MFDVGGCVVLERNILSMPCGKYVIRLSPSKQLYAKTPELGKYEPEKD